MTSFKHKFVFIEIEITKKYYIIFGLNIILVVDKNNDLLLNKSEQKKLILRKKNCIDYDL
jgi:hypothetical protein